MELKSKLYLLPDKAIDLLLNKYSDLDYESILFYMQNDLVTINRKDHGVVTSGLISRPLISYSVLKLNDVYEIDMPLNSQVIVYTEHDIYYRHLRKQMNKFMVENEIDLTTAIEYVNKGEYIFMRYLDGKEIRLNGDTILDLKLGQLKEVKFITYG